MSELGELKRGGGGRDGVRQGLQIEPSPDVHSQRSKRPS